MPVTDKKYQTPETEYQTTWTPETQLAPMAKALPNPAHTPFNPHKRRVSRYYNRPHFKVISGKYIEKPNLILLLL